MPFWRTYYHLVWATKNWEPFINEEVEAALFQYLNSMAAELGVHVYAINGWSDHIHMVFSVPPKHALAAVVKRLKGSSSHYLNTTGLPAEPFAWQRGYGVFTVGESQRDRAIAYVENQKEHHGRQTTNAWLERTAEADDPPAEPKKTDERELKEGPAGYDADDAFP